MDELIHSLIHHRISPYQYVETVKKCKQKHLSSLRKNLIYHHSPYIRLCCAWAIGEVHDKNSLKLLENAYFSETNENTRANIVWALFSIDAKYITLPLFKQFLQDPYYLIPLLSVKNISGLYWIEGRINFIPLYSKTDPLLIRLELLRNIRSFRFQSKINTYLSTKLSETSNILEKGELIRAIALTRQIDSFERISRFYESNTELFLHNDFMAYQYISAIFFYANQSHMNPFLICT